MPTLTKNSKALATRSGNRAGSHRASHRPRKGESSRWSLVSRRGRTGRRQDARRRNSLPNPRTQASADLSALRGAPRSALASRWIEPPSELRTALALPRVSAAVPGVIRISSGTKHLGLIAQALRDEGILTMSGWTGDLETSIEAAMSRLVLETGCEALGRRYQPSLADTDLKLFWTEDVERGFPDLHSPATYIHYGAMTKQSSPQGGFAIWGSQVGEIIVGTRVQQLEGIVPGFGWAAADVVLEALRQTLSVFGFGNAMAVAVRNDAEGAIRPSEDEDADEDYGVGGETGSRFLKSIVPPAAFQERKVPALFRAIKAALASPQILEDPQFARIAELSHQLLVRIRSRKPWEGYSAICDNQLTWWGDMAFFPCAMVRWDANDPVKDLCHDACKYDSNQMSWTLFQALYSWDWEADSIKPGGIRYAIRCLCWHLKMLADGWELAQLMNRDPRLMAVMFPGALEPMFPEQVQERMRVRV